MKGKQLTLDEVLNLDDGSMVWVEDGDEGDEQVGIVRQDISKNVVLDDGWGWINVEELFNHKEYVTFYEWTDDDIIEIKSNIQIRCSTCYKLAQEICNLRGINLTDDNVDKIMKEFVNKE